MVLFQANDGRPPIEVTSTNDIREYMGDSLKGYGPIEILQSQKYSGPAYPFVTNGLSITSSF